MKILPKLKSKLENAKTIEEKKQVFLDEGIELDEKELKQISAGFGSNDPLYVIDGIPFNPEEIELIDPHDIERIDVLKDASLT